MSKMQNLYTGSAGQAAVMAEFLIRGYNVAVPEVDRGDDLFVVEDSTGNYNRVQVKTATASSLKKGGYAALFSIPRAQLETPQTPNLYYVFAVRHQERWVDFVVIERRTLFDEHANHGVGVVVGDRLNIRLVFQSTTLIANKRNLQSFRNDFSQWPPIQH